MFRPLEIYEKWKENKEGPLRKECFRLQNNSFGYGDDEKEKEKEEEVEEEEEEEEEEKEGEDASEPHSFGSVWWSICDDYDETRPDSHDEDDAREPLDDDNDEPMPDSHGEDEPREQLEQTRGGLEIVYDEKDNSGTDGEEEDTPSPKPTPPPSLRKPKLTQKEIKERKKKLPRSNETMKGVFVRKKRRTGSYAARASMLVMNGSNGTSIVGKMS